VSTWPHTAPTSWSTGRPSWGWTGCSGCLVATPPGGLAAPSVSLTAGGPMREDVPVDESTEESPAWVLDEDEALELLAYLVTAARTQVDEAAEYGPLRLLTAAHRLAERVAPRASAGTARFVTGPLAQVPELAVPREGRAEYVARLDELCRAVAGLLGDRWVAEPAGPR
jgi:Family of unknown function (DUF6092)